MSGLQVAFRKAARRDIKAISAIFEAGLNRTHEFEDVRSHVREQVGDKNIETTVATDALGHIAGFVMLDLDAGRHTINVDQLAVDSAFQHKGIGTALLKHAEDVAAQKHADALTLEVRADNDNAKHLYESLGYKQLRKVWWYYADGMSAYKMKKSLLPEEPSTSGKWLPTFVRRWMGMTAPA